MASSSEFLAYVLEQLTRSVPCGDFTARKMMGEYCLYYRDKLVMEICDDQLLVRPTPTVLALMPDADRACPYEGSKTLMAVVDRLEDTELLAALTEAAYAELPARKTKARAHKESK